MKSYGLTDVGRTRATNQDSFRIDKLSDSSVLCTVCDGMGGANGGNEASEIAVNVFNTHVLGSLEQQHGIVNLNKSQIRRMLMSAIDAANTSVFNKSNSDPMLYGMGTTLVSALITEEFIYAVNVGDSRIYGQNEGELIQLSKDHSYVQYLVDEGVIRPEDAENHPQKNIITRAIGTTNYVQADYFEFYTNDFKKLLLCSDGLSNYASNSDITEIIISADGLEERVHKLIEGANNGGGGDNITAVLTDINAKEV